AAPDASASSAARARRRASSPSTRTYALTSPLRSWIRSRNASTASTGESSRRRMRAAISVAGMNASSSRNEVSEIGQHRVHDPVVVVDDRDQAPLVEGRARVRDAAAHEVPDPEVLARLQLHVGV